MYRLCHIAHKGFDVGHGGGAVLGKELDDGAADDGTIADFGHGGSLLRGGNAIADGAGQAGVLADQIHHGGNIRLDLAAGAGNVQGGNEETRWHSRKFHRSFRPWCFWWKAPPGTPRSGWGLSARS